VNYLLARDNPDSVSRLLGMRTIYLDPRSLSDSSDSPSSTFAHSQHIPAEITHDNLQKWSWIRSCTHARILPFHPRRYRRDFPPKAGPGLFRVPASLFAPLGFPPTAVNCCAFPLKERDECPEFPPSTRKAYKE